MKHVQDSRVANKQEDDGESEARWWDEPTWDDDIAVGEEEDGGRTGNGFGGLELRELVHRDAQQKDLDVMEGGDDDVENDEEDVEAVLQAFRAQHSKCSILDQSSSEQRQFLVCRVLVNHIHLWLATPNGAVRYLSDFFLADLT